MTCISFIKICSSVFYSVEPFVSEISSLTSFLDSLLLAYRNILDFCIFIFCPARNLLYSFKFLIYLKNFFLMLFSICCIILSYSP